MLIYSFLCYNGKGLSINDVPSEGEGGGPPSKPIYYISLFSNLSRQGEGRGFINSEKLAPDLKLNKVITNS